jgi:hypothetical protein
VVEGIQGYITGSFRVFESARVFPSRQELNGGLQDRWPGVAA